MVNEKLRAALVFLSLSAILVMQLFLVALSSWLYGFFGNNKLDSSGILQHQNFMVAKQSSVKMKERNQILPPVT